MKVCHVKKKKPVVQRTNGVSVTAAAIIITLTAIGSSVATSAYEGRQDARIVEVVNDSTGIPLGYADKLDEQRAVIDQLTMQHTEDMHNLAVYKHAARILSNEQTKLLNEISELKAKCWSE